MTKDEYWKLVEECLQKVLEYPALKARQQTKVFRSTLEVDCKRLKATNVIYHELPIQTACIIAKRKLSAEHIRLFEKLTQTPPEPKVLKFSAPRGLKATGTEGKSKAAKPRKTTGKPGRKTAAAAGATETPHRTSSKKR